MHRATYFYSRNLSSSIHKMNEVFLESYSSPFKPNELRHARFVIVIFKPWEKYKYQKDLHPLIIVLHCFLTKKRTHNIHKHKIINLNTQWQPKQLLTIGIISFFYRRHHI